MTSSLPRKCSTTELCGHRIQIKTHSPTFNTRVERETGLEPATLCVEGRRSSQLSYSRTALNIWGGKDSNLRRLSRQIYSLFPLTTREPPRTKWRMVKKTPPPPDGNTRRTATHRRPNTPKDLLPNMPV